MLVVGLAHVVMVWGVGVAIVRRVEAVSEVVEMLAVGIHQSLQRTWVHWRHHLNMTEVELNGPDPDLIKFLLPCVGQRVSSLCVS